MSEELNKEQEIKKRVPKKKELDLTEKSEQLVELESENLTEKYEYKADSDEVLIMDKPSQPLVIANVTDILKKEKIIMKTNKELYESYIKELKKFSLIINDDVIYDSSIDKSDKSPLKFENDYFILYGKKYSYNGLKIKKINKR